MRHWRKSAILVGLTALVLPMSGSVTRASAGSGEGSREHGPRSATVEIVGKDQFTVNRGFSETYHFEKDVVEVAAGGTITWTNQTGDGHTLSLVDAKDLPTTFNCPVCDAVTSAHFGGHPPSGPGGGGPPPTLYLDAGQPNDDDSAADADTLPDFDTTSHSSSTGPPVIGDSQLLDAFGPNNHGGPTTVKILITAPAGTLLHYMCVFHPWMQAIIKVVR